MPSPARRGPCRQTPLIILFVLAGLAAAPALCQEPPPASQSSAETQPAPASQPVSETQPILPTPTLSTGELQLRLKQAQDATDLSEDLKAQLISLYTQAVQQLQVAEQWVAKLAEFETERQQAPETLALLKTELATPLGEPVPDAPPEATRAELEQQLKQTQTDLEAEKRAQSDWERERDRRTTRRKEIPELLTAAKTRLQALTESPPAAETDQPASQRLAQQSLAQARRMAIEREIEAYNGELLSYDARRELLQARLDRAARRVGHLDKLAAGWQKLVQERARVESEQALREARAQLRRAHPVLRPLAEEREQLALRVKDIQAEARLVDERIAQTDAQLAQSSQDFERITRRVAATGLTNAIGQLLRKHRGNLPSPRPIERSLRQGRDRINSAQLMLMELEERRSDFLAKDAIVAEIMQPLNGAADQRRVETVREAAEETIAGLKSELDKLIKDYDQYFDKLVDLDGKERHLLATILRFQEYVDEKILWIRSGTLPNAADFERALEALRWLLDPRGWRVVAGSVWGTARASPGGAAVGLGVIVLIFLAQPYLRRRIRETGEVVSKPSRDSMGQTAGALLATAGLALRWPAVLWLAAWAVSSPYNSTDFAKAVGDGLRAAALVALTLQTVRHLSRPNGLAECHFRWSAKALRAVRRHVFWLYVILLPSFWVVYTLEAHTAESAKESLGRLAFVIAYLAVAVFAQRVMRPHGPVIRAALDRHRQGWLYRTRHAWFLLALAIPLALIVAAVLGYYYTAVFLSGRLVTTVWLLLGLLLLRALVQRWLLLQTRRRAMAEARERAALRRQQQQATARPGEEEVIPVEEPRVDVATLNKQTVQLVRMVLVVIGFAGTWAIWDDALPALGIFRDVTIWTVSELASENVAGPDGGSEVNEYTRIVPITLADLGLALLVALITLAAVRNIPALLEVGLLEHLPMDASGRFAVTTLTRYIITVVGVVIVFGLIGVRWSQVQWLIAAMTVGLGFGLQEIFANLVSGLMLLFERPIRIGDTVTVGEISGTVTRIRIRATTVTDWDRKELVIPNKEFITGQVINWSLSDPIIRQTVPVGIAYGSDTELAERTLYQVAEENDLIVKDPKPRVFFVGFGDSTLNFELRVFVPSVEHLLKIRHDLHMAIDRAFRQAGIEIAFPQRDVHVRSIKAALPVVNPSESGRPTLQAEPKTR